MRGRSLRSGLRRSRLAHAEISQHLTRGIVHQLLLCRPVELDGLDHVAGLLGEVGVDDDDVILEDNPDVVAAAEGDGRAFRADGRIAEEDAGGDFFQGELGRLGESEAGQGGEQQRGGEKQGGGESG